MDPTLRYVQQFGRSKRDNLRPSLLSKYHVGHTIEVYPFRIMDFGCFMATGDGLSGLLHNSEMPSELQTKLQSLIDNQESLQVRINKFDRRTGEIAFVLNDPRFKKEEAKTEAAPTVEEQAPAAVASNEAAAKEVPSVETASEAATEAAPAASPAASIEKQETPTSGELEPHKFTTSQPVHPQPTAPAPLNNESLSERMEQEMDDIQKFLESVLKSNFSPAAKNVLRDLLKETSIFRFTYAMQEVVDTFQPDLSLQLMTHIERQLKQQKK